MHTSADGILSPVGENLLSIASLMNRSRRSPRISTAYISSVARLSGFEASSARSRARFGQSPPARSAIPIIRRCLSASRASTASGTCTAVSSSFEALSVAQRMTFSGQRNRGGLNYSAIRFADGLKLGLGQRV